jgi:hypothetical protein
VCVWCERRRRRAGPRAAVDGRACCACACAPGCAPGHMQRCMLFLAVPPTAVRHQCQHDDLRVQDYGCGEGTEAVGSGGGCWLPLPMRTGAEPAAGRRRPWPPASGCPVLAAGACRAYRHAAVLRPLGAAAARRRRGGGRTRPAARRAPCGGGATLVTSQRHARPSVLVFSVWASLPPCEEDTVPSTDAEANIEVPSFLGPASGPAAALGRKQAI